MTALLTLEPRVAGSVVVEPAIRFADNPDTLHARERCPHSWCCAGSTNVCEATSPTGSHV